MVKYKMYTYNFEKANNQNLINDIELLEKDSFAACITTVLESFEKAKLKCHSRRSTGFYRSGLIKG